MIQGASDALILAGLNPMPLLGEVPLFAESFVDAKIFGWLTNSVAVAAFIALLILWATRKATRNAQRVPTGFQNFFELIVEFLYSQVEQIVGQKLAPRVFPLLATIFIYVAVANWFGLLPGVGTIGFSSEPTTALTLPDTSQDDNAVAATGAFDADSATDNDVDFTTLLTAGNHYTVQNLATGASAIVSGFTATELTTTLAVSSGDTYAIRQDPVHVTPLLRPPTADLNLTLGMAAVFMLIWVYLTVRETGVIGFIKHTFGPKGGIKGLLGMVLVPVFMFVGVIELISIALRPVSLSLRLFGNVFAGENLMHVMGGLGDNAGAFFSFVISVLLPLPTFFLELMVGGLQAMVFALLCAVYIQLSTTHDEEEGH